MAKSGGQKAGGFFAPAFQLLKDGELEMDSEMDSDIIEKFATNANITVCESKKILSNLDGYAFFSFCVTKLKAQLCVECGGKTEAAFTNLTQALIICEKGHIVEKITLRRDFNPFNSFYNPSKVSVEELQEQKIKSYISCSSEEERLKKIKPKIITYASTKNIMLEEHSLNALSFL